MSWRAVLLLSILLPGLAGCAGNRLLIAPGEPIFGRGAVDRPWPGTREIALQDAGRVEQIDVAADEVPRHAVYSAAQEPWPEAQVVPVALSNSDPDGYSEHPYLLDSGDRLRIFVYGQPNLSRTYIVDNSGWIPVPLIGNINARGLTTSGLASAIRDRLGRDYVRDPQVTVDILQNRPFFILGEVRNAGQYPYVSGMTVETAVAIAGGYTERASQRTFRVTRRVDGIVEQIEAPSDYVVKPGDTVFVYERFF